MVLPIKISINNLSHQEQYSNLLSGEVLEPECGIGKTHSNLVPLALQVKKYMALKIKPIYDHPARTLISELCKFL